MNIPKEVMNRILNKLEMADKPLTTANINATYKEHLEAKKHRWF